jgi:hypothetical protein
VVAPLGRLSTTSHSRDYVVGEVAALLAVGRRDAHPRTRAAVDWHETLGLTQKSISVDNIIAQSNQEASDAAYLRQAGSQALKKGCLNLGREGGEGVAACRGEG